MRKFITIEELTQGSDDWLAWRRTVIGASDAPTIMGENPWKSREYLELEKIGETASFAGNTATRRGQELEPIARALVSKRLGKAFSPMVVQSTTMPWLAASLDGFDRKSSTVVEIKCGLRAHEYTNKTGKVPPYYFGQLQHILLVTGLKSLMYFSFIPDTADCLIEINRDDGYIERLLHAISEFRTKLELKGYKLRETLHHDKNLQLLKNNYLHEPTHVTTSLSQQPEGLTDSEIQQLRYFLNISNEQTTLAGTTSLIRKTLEDGSIFIGEHDNHTPSGIGALVSDEKLRYLGNWEKNLRTGPGLYRSADQVVHIGIFKKELLTGEGLIISPDDTYIGEIVNGETHGFGSKTFSDGSRYIGQWRNGQPNGHGHLIFDTDGFREYDLFECGCFEGNFRDGKPDGHGRWWWGDVCLIGSWTKGKLAGDAIVISFETGNTADQVTVLPQLFIRFPQFVCIGTSGCELTTDFRNLRLKYDALRKLKDDWNKISARGNIPDSNSIQSMIRRLDITLAEWDEAQENCCNFLEERFIRVKDHIKNIGTDEDYLLVDSSLKDAKQLRGELYKLYRRLLDSFER